MQLRNFEQLFYGSVKKSNKRLDKWFHDNVSKQERDSPPPPPALFLEPAPNCLSES